MKLVNLSIWTLLIYVALANPLHFDIRVDVKSDDTPPSIVRNPHRARPDSAEPTSTELPIVDIGIGKVQADPESKDKTYYVWKNIPYARQPTGQRRFKAAEPFDYSDYPEEPELLDTSKDVVCPQEQVGWFPSANAFAAEVFNVTTPLDPKWRDEITTKQYRPLSDIEPVPNQNESCLVLDIYVPKRLYDKQDYAAVLVSFHGGGFIFGSKTIFGSPEGLIKQAAAFDEKSDIVVVTVNYRLGALGWLAGEDFESQGGLANAGLTDQKVALQWIRSWIPEFYGNSYDVTAMGESAGASSLLHHLTAYFPASRRDWLPSFSRAILQSPAYFPNVDQKKQNETFSQFLKAAKVNTLAELRDADTAVLLKANRETIYYSPYGQFTYGPVVSSKPGTWVRAPPSIPLRYGSYYKVPLMISHNRFEGVLFTPPWIRTNDALAKFMKKEYPLMPKDELEEFTKLYPINEDETDKDRFLAAARPFGDLGVDCNVYAIYKYQHEVEGWYEYFYNIYPAFHGMDVGATWWPHAGENLTKLNSPSQSQRLQRYLTSFVQTGNPNDKKGKDDARFENVANGGEGRFMYIGGGIPTKPPLKDIIYGMNTVKPFPKAEICDYWNFAPYWGNGDEESMSRKFGGGANAQNPIIVQEGEFQPEL